MKVALLMLMSAITGYTLGTQFPPIDIITPMRQIEFESDYTIKAGTKASSRYFGTSFEPVNLPVEITLAREDVRKLKSSRSAGADQAPQCLKMGEFRIFPGPPGRTKTEQQCCAGLKLVEPKSECLPRGGLPSSKSGVAKLCVACGDGKCDKDYEANCNCPEDCG